MSTKILLPPATRSKLVGALHLLGSDQPGERDAAGLAATRFMRGLNLSWNDIIPGESVPPPPPNDWRVSAMAALRTSPLLTDWERRFVANLVINFRDLSEK